jgi:uncharacterized membrane protein
MTLRARHRHRWGCVAVSVALAATALTLTLTGYGAASAAASGATSRDAVASPTPWRGPLGSDRDDDNTRGHGFVRDDRGYRTVDVRGASATDALGGNNRGQVVGGYVDVRDRFHGFVQRGHRVETLDVPGARGTMATRINDEGEIVGLYTNRRSTPGAQMEHGFLYDGTASGGSMFRARPRPGRLASTTKA